MSNPSGTSEVTDEDILAVMRESTDPVLTAGEVAEHLPIGRRAIHDRLVDLHDRELVNRKNIGPRTVWWPTDAGAVEDAPAATLRQLIGGLDEDTARKARERSQAWRDEIDEELAPENGST